MTTSHDLDAAIDALLGSEISASPELRRALATQFDKDLRFHGWSRPEGPSFAWHGWTLMVWHPGARRPSVPSLSGAERCSCMCWGPPCESDRIGKLLESKFAALGFWTGPDRQAARHGHCLVFANRAVARRGLRGLLGWYPTGAKCQFYVDRNTEHSAGPRYASVPEKAALYLDRKLFELVRAQLSAVLVDAGYVDRTVHSLAGIDKARWRQVTSGHWRPGRGFDTSGTGSKLRTGDGQPLTDGVRVQFYGDDGRGGGLREGIVFYHLNDSWNVVSGDQVLSCIASGDLLTWREGRPRRWTPLSERRRAVIAALATAVKAERFERAALLRDARRRLESAQEILPEGLVT